jgi:hypothetical protein
VPGCCGACAGRLALRDGDGGGDAGGDCCQGGAAAVAAVGVLRRRLRVLGGRPLAWPRRSIPSTLCTSEASSHVEWVCRSPCGLNLPVRFGQVPAARPAALCLRLPLRIGIPGQGSA